MAKRQIRAKDMIADIRGGVDNAALMEKYEISANVLEAMFKKLLAAGAMLEVELAGRMPVEQEDGPVELEVTATFGTGLRKFPRSYVMVRLPIYDLDDLTAEANVEDISENGMMIAGIQVQAGDVKSLLLQSDEFADVFPFTFDVTCRWADNKSDGRCIAGFEITNISEVGKSELRKLCRLLGLT